MNKRLFLHTDASKMLLPKGGVTWKSAKAHLPPWKAVLMLISKLRFIISIAAAGLVVLLWGGVSRSTAEMQRFILYPLPASIYIYVCVSVLTATPIDITASAHQNLQTTCPPTKW